jgi:hypothetical protein
MARGAREKRGPNGVGLSSLLSLQIGPTCRNPLHEEESFSRRDGVFDARQSAYQKPRRWTGGAVGMTGPSPGKQYTLSEGLWVQILSLAAESQRGQ